MADLKLDIENLEEKNISTIVNKNQINFGIAKKNYYFTRAKFEVLNEKKSRIIKDFKQPVNEGNGIVINPYELEFSWDFLPGVREIILYGARITLLSNQGQLSQKVFEWVDKSKVPAKKKDTPEAKLARYEFMKKLALGSVEKWDKKIEELKEEYTELFDAIEEVKRKAPETLEN